MLEKLNDVESVPNAVRLTVPAKPLMLARSIFEVSDPPGARAITVFSADMTKSGPVTLAEISVE